MQCFDGLFVHSRSLADLEFVHGSIFVDSGKIVAIARTESERADFISTSQIDEDDIEHIALGRRFLVPGFIDTHTHAPQNVFMGTGRIPLLEWLQQYTFPTESKFSDVEFANHVYDKSVRRHVLNGTTTCCYYATIHLESSVALAKVAQRYGQRAFIGKVCMDRNSPDFYSESTQDSIRDTKLFVDAIAALNDPLISPIITPRFAPTCSSALMHALGGIANEHQLPIQTHISENLAEIAWVHALHPECSCYADVYASHGLLTNRTILAHAVHLTDDDRRLIREAGAGIAHCPNSNFALFSGTFDVRRALSDGLNVGLGTDVAGGSSPSMLDAIRQALVASASLAFEHRKMDSHFELYKPVSPAEAFFLATLGGAQVCGLGDCVGNFQVGKEFDALIINPYVLDSPIDVFASDRDDDVFLKFLFTGDDRNIETIYVKGVACNTDSVV